MNVHESEKIAGILEEKGYASGTISDADVIVFNTCCIRDNAEQKIFGNIGDVKKLKKAKPSLIVAVVGCMTQQKGVGETLRSKFPYVDIVMGTGNLEQLGSSIDSILSKRRFVSNICCDEKPPIIEDIPVFRTSGTNAWVNIMYGCNNFCTYCIVPYVRGRERSRDPKAVLDEVKSLVDEGYKEITLLGQNVDSYGSDFENGWKFADLLENIAKIDGKFRLRFMSSHPKDFNERVIDVIKSCDNICNNIHLPVQSGSDRILKLMNRKYDRDKYLRIVEQIKTLPNVGLTTDIMVGFPTETDADFADTVSLTKEVRFSTAFTFVYSPRAGTAAAAMEQLSEEIKKERIQEIVALQNAITMDISKTYVGNAYEVLAEDDNPKYDGCLCGRTESGRLVTFPKEDVKIGDFVKVLVEGAKSASLLGRAISND